MPLKASAGMLLMLLPAGQKSFSQFTLREGKLAFCNCSLFLFALFVFKSVFLSLFVIYLFASFVPKCDV